MGTYKTFLVCRRWTFSLAIRETTHKNPRLEMLLSAWIWLFCPFTEILNAQKMLRIYIHVPLKSAEKIFGANIEDWILPKDNEPKHRSRLCTDWKTENGILTLDLPPQSPDANPIMSEVSWRGSLQESVFSSWSYSLDEIRRHGILFLRNMLINWSRACSESSKLSLRINTTIALVYQKRKIRIFQNFLRKRVPFLVEQTVNE